MSDDPPLDPRRLPLPLAVESVAVWKMEGQTNREIAEKLGCVEQTVERKLRSIRRLWLAEGPA
jgi:DNA-binding NarL/FixJ family response regulator